MHTRTLHRVRLTALLAALAVGSSCQSFDNSAKNKGATGAAFGALAGQLIGGDTESTLIGAAVGGGIGYMVGNEEDKEHAEQMSQRTEEQDYAHPEVGPLANTRWKLVSLVPREFAQPYVSKIVEFGPSGTVTTTTTTPEGDVQLVDERYRVVGDTLICNKPGYLINATFAVEGNQLIVSAEQFRAVLERL